MNIEQYYNQENGRYFDEIAESVSLQELSGWEEYYWAGLYLNKYSPDATFNELIIEALEESFFEGLTYLSNTECYLNAIKILGKLYLELQQYDLAINMF